MTAQPYPYPVVLTPASQPPPLPTGYGCLVYEFSRGPYVIPAWKTMRFSVAGTSVPVNQGRWFVPVVAGQQRVKVADVFGFPVMTADVNIQPGGSEYRLFDFGVWRNRVKDGSGADVTRFGMWSSYAFLAIGLIVLVLCCVGGALLPD